MTIEMLEYSYAEGDYGEITQAPPRPDELANAPNGYPGPMGAWSLLAGGSRGACLTSKGRHAGIPWIRVRRKCGAHPFGVTRTQSFQTQTLNITIAMPFRIRIFLETGPEEFL